MKSKTKSELVFDHNDQSQMPTELADLGLKRLGISIENHLDSLVTLVFSLKGVEAANAVAIVAKRAHCEAVAVPGVK